MNRLLVLALGAALALSPAHAQETADPTEAPLLDGGPVDDAPDPGPDAEAAAPAAPAAPHVPGPLTTDLAGAYLAARQAAEDNDFAVAANYFARALKHDPREPFLIDSTLVSMIASGMVDRAVALAREQQAAGDLSDLGGLALRAAAAKSGDWAELSRLTATAPDAAPGDDGNLMDRMLAAYAELGAGRASEAMKALQALTKVSGARQMVEYNLALVKASVGDFEGAAALMDKPGVGGHMMGTIARAEVLAQLDRRDEALSVIEAQPGASEEPALLDLSARLASGQDVPFTALKSPADGVAQTLLTFATALAGDSEPDPLALVHARLAAWIEPDLGEARLLSAQLLQAAGQFDLAETEYEAMRKAGAARPVAELARMDALARNDRLDDAKKAALALTASHPEMASAWVAQGDILRQAGDYKAAIPSYDKALSLIAEADGEARWFPLYARGIAHERSGDFAAAEADMRASLKIRPDQAQVLNYLGYSFIDRGINLAEGMAMVEKAAKLRPEDGYIQDSLAWGYFRLGRYAEAVAPMERAAETMAHDPLINDHLGDIYWMVGRKREAEVQWRRALNLASQPGANVEDLDLDRIRAKLERGLDAVRAEEAKAPASGN